MEADSFALSSASIHQQIQRPNETQTDNNSERKGGEIWSSLNLNLPSVFRGVGGAQAPAAFAYAAQQAHAHAHAQVMAMVAPPTGVETGTKLYISNLDYNVSNEDIKELFAEVGDLKRYSINYDKSGRSKGTAEVIFSRKSDALAALKRYNNVQLDGKPMKIEVIGTNIEAPPPPAIFTLNTPTIGNFIPSYSGGRGRGGDGGRGWPRGRGGFGGRSAAGRGRGRGDVGLGRGRGGRGSQPVSANDLDADLDKYHSEAMQTS
ncbi:THO complex subunit 4-A [Triticum urartu]|uniref:THO complex subunit 4-A n=1 Tax=Triticum urartu TaxID=4572 RepID=M7ZI11_TRIUA|nr:THO complex subunit 4-A [Triticum urartu]